MSTLREQLYGHCLQLINLRVENARRAMEAAEEAMANETKSSVGDKYETGRAMMQIEREKHKVQLLKTLQLRKELQVVRQAPTDTRQIRMGQLVLTDTGYSFLAIGLGKVLFNEQTFFVISASSPIGRQLLGQSVGDQIKLNQRQINILQIN